MRPDEIADGVRKGDIRSAARLMRGLDDGDRWAVEALKLLRGRQGRARIIGLTGAPGVGKSSLTDAIVGRFRERGLTVGVVAVDPTSPFSGGAILGDRVRMQRHATDEGVYIRSLATRGHFGGLTTSTQAVVKVMDAMGKDVILVETVGVGQDEVEIVRLADTTVVVTVPGMGDDIQAIKAGILEVADIFVVNKMDREGVARTVSELQYMLSMDQGKKRREGWEPIIVPTSALDGRGMDDFMDALDRHWAHLNSPGTGLLETRRRERVRAELLDLVRTGAVNRLMARLETDGVLDKVIEQILQGKSDPHTAGEDLVSRWLN